MIEVNFNTLPYYLTNSELYNTLLNQTSDEESFTIEPVKIVTFDVIDSITVFQQVIDMLNYWQSYNIPQEVMVFVVKNQKRFEKEIQQLIKKTVFKNKLMALFDDGEDLIIKSVKLGFQDMVDFSIYHCHPDKNNFKICSTAALMGHMDLLIYLIEKNFYFDENTCSEAALGGHLEIIKYLHAEHNCLGDNETCAAAASRGHLEILKYLHENGCHWDENTTYDASYNGHLCTLQYAHENGCPWDEQIIENSAFGGYIDCLTYAYDNGLVNDSALPRIIFTIRRKEILKFYIDLNIANDLFTELKEVFAEKGNLDMLKFLHENGIEWSDKCCEYTAKEGQLDTLKYCHENGAPWDQQSSINAALNDDIEMLKYLHEEGCPIDVETSNSACEGGSLECLKFLHENGYPWNIYTFLIASMNFEVDCLKYLFENNCPLPSNEMLDFKSKSTACDEYIKKHIYS